MAMAGPDEIDGVGLKLDLPTPRQTKLGDYKVAVWNNEAMAPVSSEVEERVTAVAKTISDAGGTVDFDAPSVIVRHARVLQSSQRSKATREICC